MAWRGQSYRAAPTADLDLVRTACVVGSARHVARTVTALFRHGMAPTAIAVTPSTTHAALGGSLKARLDAQDMADSLRAKLSLYPSAKGLVPLVGMAPEAVHASDDFKYVFIAGPPFWRKELAALSLRGGKHVVVAPPRTAAEAQELVALAKAEHGAALLHDELRFSPSVDALRELVRNKEVLGPPSSLHLCLALAPPLCCSEGHPTADERAAPGGWWRSRARGGGALGAAGVQAFELLQHLIGVPAVAVRAAPGDDLVGGTPAKLEADDAPERCVVELRMGNGATAALALDWRDAPAEQPAARVIAEGREGRATLDLRSGALTLERAGEGAPTIVAMAEGGDLTDEATQALAETLMRSQAEGGEAIVDVDGALMSYAAVAACYRSLDATHGGEAWEEVV